MRQEIFELKKQRESLAMDLLDALKKYSGTDEISEDVLGPLKSMMHQLTAMHKNDLE